MDLTEGIEEEYNEAKYSKDPAQIKAWEQKWGAPGTGGKGPICWAPNEKAEVKYDKLTFLTMVTHSIGQKHQTRPGGVYVFRSDIRFHTGDIVLCDTQYGERAARVVADSGIFDKRAMKMMATALVVTTFKKIIGKYELNKFEEEKDAD